MLNHTEYLAKWNADLALARGLMARSGMPELRLARTDEDDWRLCRMIEEACPFAKR